MFRPGALHKQTAAAALRPILRASVNRVSGAGFVLAAYARKVENVATHCTPNSLGGQ